MMSHLSVQLTSDTESLLKHFMKIRHISNKSEAVRIAIREVVSIPEKKNCDFTAWIGLAQKGKTRGKLEKLSDSELWG